MQNFRLQRAALFAVAAFVSGMPMLMPAPAAAQNWAGSNVTHVRVNDGGSFAQVAPGRWEQYEPNGRVWARLDEVRRDGDTVLLEDRTRRVQVLLDLRRREVRGTEERTGRWRRFYTITDVNWRRPGGEGRRDVRDRDARDDVRDDRRDARRDDGRAVEVGPIWNQRDAEAKCTARARELRGEWTGQWWTTRPGRMSVCQIETRGGRRWEPRDVVREIEVGPIWNQNDAVGKCNGKARELRAEWTGQWRTTVTGRMSVCEIRFD